MKEGSESFINHNVRWGVSRQGMDDVKLGTQYMGHSLTTKCLVALPGIISLVAFVVAVFVGSRMVEKQRVKVRPEATGEAPPGRDDSLRHAAWNDKKPTPVEKFEPVD